MERKDFARGLYTRCVQEIAAARIANLPAAVSNNWLPRQVHIPPIMCINAPCAAIPCFGRMGYRGRYASSASRRYIYLRLASLKHPSMSGWSMLRLDTLSSRSLSRFKNRYLLYTIQSLRNRCINKQEKVSTTLSSVHDHPTRLLLIKFLLLHCISAMTINTRNIFSPDI